MARFHFPISEMTFSKDTLITFVTREEIKET